MTKKSHRDNWLLLVAATLVILPALYFRLQDIHPSPQVGAIVFGIAIVGGAFLLAWGCEVAQVEIPQALALAVLALIAVLPEYAVDFYFAWTAAEKPEYSHYAIANMTGANRLLIGIGWSAVVFLCWLRFRTRAVTLGKNYVVEIAFLAAATLYVFIIPIKGTLSLMDSAVLVPLFFLYLWVTSRMGREEPTLTGPPAAVAALPTLPRRIATVLLFLFPGVVILASAAPFAESLIGWGKVLNIDEFIMVQWVAPLASEAPEMVVASLFALQGKATMALVALVSSKVNQWTLLVGTLPIVYSFSLGSPGALPLDSRQTQEVLLTAAQSAFAIALLTKMQLTTKGAWVLFLLFATQLFFFQPIVRYSYSFLYLGLTLLLILRDGKQLRQFLGAAATTLNGLRSSRKS